jgi:hypothetical protein
LSTDELLPQCCAPTEIAFAPSSPDGGAPGAKSKFTENTLCIAWSIYEMNRLSQPIQDKILDEIQLNGVLGGVSV